MALQFGLNAAIPSEVKTAWGARWIYPNDQLPDRQDLFSDTPAARAELIAWLNGGAISRARENAQRLAYAVGFSSRDQEPFVLFEDAAGWIIGNPQRSYGYVYVAGFLKAHAPSGFVPVARAYEPPKPKRASRARARMNIR